MIKPIALYPGCSLEGTSRAFYTSLTAVLETLEAPWEEMRDWNCCGASSAHAMNHRLYLTLGARNLALAQAQGHDEILAPCAACYHRLVCAQMELSRSPESRLEINNDADIDYQGKVSVCNALDYFMDRIGVGTLAERVTKPFDGLRVACYYGCLNSRLPHAGKQSALPPNAGKSATLNEYPTSMDDITRALGASPLDWSYKTECCGASLFATAESVSANLVAHILKDAIAVGADCVCVACPMCHNNLDVKQDSIRERYGLARPMPVLFITQLMGLALGLPVAALRLSDAFVPFCWSAHKRQSARKEAATCP